MSEVNPEQDSLSVGMFLDSRGIYQCLIAVEIINVEFVLGMPRSPTHKAHAQTLAYQLVEVQILKKDTSRSNLKMIVTCFRQ